MSPAELAELVRTDLNLLRAFDAMMAERSVSLAAARLSVGQPAMSASLQRLRRLFGDPLLVREAGALVPTPLAESLHPPIARALVLLADTLHGRRDFDPATAERTFRLAAGDDVILLLLEPLLRTLRTQAPRVTVHVLPAGPETAGDVRRGEVDLAVTSTVVDDPGDRLRGVELWVDDYCCAVAEDHDLLAGPDGPPTWADLARRALLVHDDGFLPEGLPRLLDAAGDTAPSPSAGGVDIVTQSPVVTGLLLEGSQRVSLLPSLLAAALGRRARIRTLPAPAGLPPIVHRLVWSAWDDTEPGLVWVRERVLAAARTVVGPQS